MRKNVWKQKKKRFFLDLFNSKQFQLKRLNLLLDCCTDLLLYVLKMVNYSKKKSEIKPFVHFRCHNLSEVPRSVERRFAKIGSQHGPLPQASLFHARIRPIDIPW